jgi:hypothetical protein
MDWPLAVTTGQERSNSVAEDWPARMQVNRLHALRPFSWFVPLDVFSMIGSQSNTDGRRTLYDTLTMARIDEFIISLARHVSPEYPPRFRSR